MERERPQIETANNFHLPNGKVISAGGRVAQFIDHVGREPILATDLTEIIYGTETPAHDLNNIYNLRGRTNKLLRENGYVIDNVSEDKNNPVYGVKSLQKDDPEVFKIINLDNEQYKRRVAYYRAKYPAIFNVESNILADLESFLLHVVNEKPYYQPVEEASRFYKLKLKDLDELHAKKIIGVVSLDGIAVIGKRDILLGLSYKNKDISGLNYTDQDMYQLRVLAKSLIKDGERLLSSVA